VHVVIIGLVRRDQETPVKRLFSFDDINGDPVESRHAALTAYLFSAETVQNRHLVVVRSTTSLMNMPLARVGSKPVDGGHYIIDGNERNQLVEQHPDLKPFIRPFVGGHELINGGDRWIFCLQNAAPEQMRHWPEVRRKIEQVRHYRESEGGALARSLAETPCEFHVTVFPKVPFLAIPEVSSERRDYVPIGWLNPPTIPSNQIIVVENATIEMFGILASRMHMAWLRHIGGRLESRYRYSTGIVYNTFPWPDANKAQSEKVQKLAQAVLDARSKFPNATFADLYDADIMKPELRHAHHALDAAVDRLYRAAEFPSDRDRVEHLFGLYERLVAPLMATPRSHRRRAKTRSTPPA